MLFFNFFINFLENFFFIFIIYNFFKFLIVNIINELIFITHYFNKKFNISLQLNKLKYFNETILKINNNYCYYLFYYIFYKFI